MEQRERLIEEINRPMNEALFNNFENQYKKLAKVKDEGEQIDPLTELLIDFDEMGFAPTTTCPDPDAYAIEWKNKLTNALQGFRKQSDVAREIFGEIDRFIYKVLNDEHYIMGDMCWDVAELKKKYTEG